MLSVRTLGRKWSSTLAMETNLFQRNSNKQRKFGPKTADKTDKVEFGLPVPANCTLFQICMNCWKNMKFLFEYNLIWQKWQNPFCSEFWYSDRNHPENKTKLCFVSMQWKLCHFYLIWMLSKWKFVCFLSLSVFEFLASGTYYNYNALEVVRVTWAKFSNSIWHDLMLEHTHHWLFEYK